MLLHYLGKLKTICKDTFLETLSTLQWTFWTPFVNKLMQTIWIFNVFWVQVAFADGVRFLLCWYLTVYRPTLLSCKALSLLRTVNEQTVNVDILHSVNLCTCFHDIKYMIKSDIWNMFYMHKVRNFSSLSFPRWYGFCWKFIAFCSSDRILQIDQELTKL